MVRVKVHNEPKRPPRYLPSFDGASLICALLVTMAHICQPPLREGIYTGHPLGFAIHGFNVQRDLFGCGGDLLLCYLRHRNPLS